MKPIEILPPDEFKVLKVIQIEGPEWNRFTGYLPYLRLYNPKNYNSEASDELDERVLSVVKQRFENSFLRFNISIFFKGQLEESLKNLEGGTRKSVTIQFYPLISFELAPKLVGQTFYAYPMEFQMRLLLNGDSEKSRHIDEFFLCNLPLDSLDDDIKTIKPV